MEAYTLRFVTPPSREEIPALAERLSTIIKTDPDKLQSLLGRSSGNLIKGTTNVQAEKVATIFRSVGLDVEVVAAESPSPAPAAGPGAEHLREAIFVLSFRSFACPRGSAPDRKLSRAADA